MKKLIINAILKTKPITKMCLFDNIEVREISNEDESIIILLTIDNIFMLGKLFRMEQNIMLMILFMQFGLHF